MNLRYIVIDDEQLSRKLIVSHAAKVDSLVFAGECSNAIDGANLLRKTRVDIIFLDIQMPELTGLEFIKTLKAPPAIVLTTAHREFAADAFELDVVDYLVKPISFERFLKAVNKLTLYHQANEPSETPSEVPGMIYVKADRKVFPVELGEILYIESLDNYVKVHLRNRTITTRENITQFEAMLPSTQFVRIHRSFIVSRKHIESISSETVQISGKELPIGRAFKQTALRLLK